MTGEDELAAALADDLDAGFVAMVRAHQAGLVGAALRLTGRRADAEDLVADALLKAFGALLAMEPDRRRALRVRPWLFTIVVNHWRNVVRARVRRPIESPLDGIPERAGRTGSPEELAIGADTRRELADRLTALPPRQREAVVLRHVLDLPTAEVAQILGCPEATARSHLARGLAALRSSYATDSSVARPARKETS